MRATAARLVTVASVELTEAVDRSADPGAEELNCASDIDVMFVGDGDVRNLLRVARTCFRVDADLRPEGRGGPLIRSLESFEAYWDRWAQTWEFQALLKARPVAGNLELGSAFAQAAAERVGSRPFGVDDLRRQQAAARAIHERLYFRPLLEAFTGGTGPAANLPPEAVEARLAAFGFTDAERTRQAMQELTRGLTRSSRLMQQLLPLLLGWLSEAPDPDLGLLGLRTLATGRHRSAQLVGTFRESPQTARRLCLLVGTSRLLVNALEHHPDLIPALGDDRRLLRATTRDDLAKAAATVLAG